MTSRDVLKNTSTSKSPELARAMGENDRAHGKENFLIAKSM